MEQIFGLLIFTLGAGFAFGLIIRVLELCFGIAYVRAAQRAVAQAKRENKEQTSYRTVN